MAAPVVKNQVSTATRSEGAPVDVNPKHYVDVSSEHYAALVENLDRTLAEGRAALTNALTGEHEGMEARIFEALQNGLTYDQLLRAEQADQKRGA